MSKVFEEKDWEERLKDEIKSKDYDIDLCREIINSWSEESFNKFCYGDKSIVVKCVQYDNSDILNLFIDRGLDINKKICLHVSYYPKVVVIYLITHAITYKSYKIFNLLLEKNIDINVKSGYYNCTPLIYAVYKSNSNNDIINSLIQHKADLNVQDSNGRTALYYAVSGRKYNITKTLLTHNADPNICEYNGCSPLQQICRSHRLDMISLLVRNNADINYTNNDGETCIDIAQKANVKYSVGIIRYLNIHKNDK